MPSALAQEPIVVDVAQQTPPAHDITIDVILGMFAMAGVFLLVAVIGCAIVAGAMLAYKRWRDATAPPPETPHSHIRLEI